MMSGNYGNNKYNKSLPATIKCAVDGRFEPNSMYSNRQISSYLTTNGKARVTCRKHTPGLIAERLCSVCRKIKLLDHFSRNERRLNGTQRCRDCVEWTEGDMAGYNPLPAPNARRALDEMELYERHNDDKVLDFDDDEDDEDDPTAGLSADHAPSCRRALSPGRGLTSQNLQALNTLHPASLGGQSYHASSAQTDIASNTVTEATAHPRNTVEFNAYGPDGQSQRRVKTFTATSETAITVISASVSANQKWARPPTRKTGPSIPAFLEREDPNTVGNYFEDDDESADEC